MNAIKKVPKRNLTLEEAARRRLVNKIVVFVLAIVVKCGRKLPCTVKDFFTRTVRECDFDHFSILSDTRQSAVGGNDVKIWWDGLLVFHMHWENEMGEFEPLLFDPDPDWQSEIQQIIRHPKRIANRLDCEARRANERELKQRKREERKKEACERLTQEYQRRLARIQGTVTP